MESLTESEPVLICVHSLHDSCQQAGDRARGSQRDLQMRRPESAVCAEVQSTEATERNVALNVSAHGITAEFGKPEFNSCGPHHRSWIAAILPGEDRVNGEYRVLPHTNHASTLGLTPTTDT